MLQFTILYYIEKENRTVVRDINSIDQARAAVFLNKLNYRAETMIFSMPETKLIYYCPAKGKATLDTWKLDR